MANFKVRKSHLQTEKFDYINTVDRGDDPDYRGKLDQQRVDKDEIYEVIYFIQSLMDKHDLSGQEYVHKIEDALHDQDLSDISSRTTLISEVEEKLDLIDIETAVAKALKATEAQK